MDIPKIETFHLAGGFRTVAICKLRGAINRELRSHYDQSKAKGREHLAMALLEKVNGIIQTLNDNHYDLGCIDYSGDRNYENSEQLYCNGDEMGTGLILHFRAYACDVSWIDSTPVFRLKCAVLAAAAISGAAVGIHVWSASSWLGPTLVIGSAALALWMIFLAVTR
jgi:hypothetical protein